METSGKTPCTIKAALTLSYTEASETYSAFVSSLLNNTSQMSKEEYDKLHAITAQWRWKREKARLDLEEHLERHGC